MHFDERDARQVDDVAASKVLHLRRRHGHADCIVFVLYVSLNVWDTVRSIDNNFSIQKVLSLNVSEL